MTIEDVGEAEKELTNIRPSKVSLVDLGANNQFFFIAKSVSPEVEKTPDVQFKTAVIAFSNNILNRIETTREWLANAETDEASDIPAPLMSLISRTRDETELMAETVKSGGTYLDDVKVSGAKRDQMVLKLDILAENFTTSLTLLNEEGGNIPTEFTENLQKMIDGFDNIIGSSEDVVEETQVEEIQEDGMTIKFVEIAKAADRIDLEEVEVKKQATSAQAKLNDIFATFQIDSEDVYDSWDIRWRIGEVIDILVDAAKLEGILDTTIEKAVEKAKEDKGMAETNVAVETPAVVTPVVAAPVAAPVVAAPAVTTPAVDAAVPAVSADVPAVTPVVPAAPVSAQGDMVEILKSAIADAVAPLNARLEAIEKAATETTEVVEKMQRTRPASQGAAQDETSVVAVEKNVNEQPGSFAAYMPPHLRGTVQR